jgi:ATP-binding cassette subfamily C protein
MKLKDYFYELLRGNKSRIGLYFVLSMLFAGISSLIPLISGNFIDGLVYDPSFDMIITFSKTVVLLGFISIVSSYVLNIMKIKMQVDFGAAFNFRIIKHIQNLNLSFILQKNPVYISQRVNADSNVIVGFILNNISQTTISLLQFLIVLTYIFVTNQLLGGIILLLDFLYVILYFVVKKKIEKCKYQLKDSTALYSASLQTQLTKLKYIKASSLEELFHSNLEKALKILRIDVIRNQKLTYWVQSGEMIIFMIVQISLFFVGGIEIINKRMTVGEFTILLSYTSMLLSSTKYFATLSNAYLDAKVSMDRVNEFLQLKPLESGTETIESVESIEIVNINFGYNGPLITNFSYNFELGNIYCIKGDNGAGKTTILDLLDGFYYSDANGLIYINEIELNEINIEQYRKNNIAYHLQQSEILEGSFLEAVTYGVDSYEKSFLEYMIKGFGLERFNSEDVNAQTLSGGEKQKISLIRTILRNTQVILLDEPENGLDQKSRLFLAELLKLIQKNKIIIMVTHNDYIIECANEMLYM